MAHVERNPANGVKLYKENNRRLRYLTVEECKLFRCLPFRNYRQVCHWHLTQECVEEGILNLDTGKCQPGQGNLIGDPEQKNGER